MKTLKLVSLTALMSLAVFAVTAQPGGGQRGPQGQRPQQAKEQKEMPTAEDVAAKKTESLKVKLSLTAAQEKKVSALFLEFAKEDLKKKEERKAAKESGEKPEMKALVIDGYTISPQAQMEKAKKERLVKVMGLLTDTQKVDYAIMISEQGKKGGKQGMQGRGQGRGQGPQQGMQQRGGQGQKLQMQQGQKPQRPQGQRPAPKAPEAPAAEQAAE